MNRVFRLLWIIFRSFWGPRCPRLGPCHTKMRVLPNDLDLFFHVNNGVYLTLCDLARVDLLLRSGTFRKATARGRNFLVAAETVQLYRPLRLFQRFWIETVVLGWDDRAFFVEHRFYTRHRNGDEDTVAAALVEGRLADRKAGTIAPADLLGDLDHPLESPPLPEWVTRWRDDQRDLRRSVRAGAARGQTTDSDL